MTVTFKGAVRARIAAVIIRVAAAGSLRSRYTKVPNELIRVTTPDFTDDALRLRADQRARTRNCRCTDRIPSRFYHTSMY